MSMLQSYITQGPIYKLFEPYLPGDHHRPGSPEDYARKICAASSAPLQVLDLGCGAGASRAMFRSLQPGCGWHGAEVAGSPELSAAAAVSDGIVFFDGVNLPWGSGHFDLVYSNQVLEHVRRPDALLADVCRVLKPGGALVGSVSYLEPYHSLSLFNFTPYGVITVLGDAGFRVAELRPGRDCCSIIHRQMVGGHPRLSELLHRFSPLSAAITMAGLLGRLDNKARNFLKIQFAGHICFLAYRDRT